MADPNAFGGSRMQYSSYYNSQSHTGQEINVPPPPPLHQTQGSFGQQHSNEMSFPRNNLGPQRPEFLARPRNNMMYPPSIPPPSFPPPPHGQGVQQAFPPMPPNFNYSTPPPMPYPVNRNLMPPQAQQGRIPPPALGPPPGQFHNNPPIHGFVNAGGHHRMPFNDIADVKGNKNDNSFEDKCKQDGKNKIMSWLQKHGKGKSGQRPGQKKERSEFKVNGYMCSLQKMATLISEMSSKIENLESNLPTADKSFWTSCCSDFDEAKGAYTTMENLLDDQVVSHAEKKLARIRHRRARIRRLRQAEKEEKMKKQEAREERDKKINEWQKQIQEEMKEEKRKKERKINMDRTLAEITKKIQDANRLIETMNAVEKLRLIRRDAAEKRGDSDLGESRENVAQKIEDMRRLVQGQLEAYKEEEQTLRDAIKSEYEKSNKKEKRLQNEKDEAEKKEKDRDLYSMLFGHFGEAEVTDLLYPYQEFYKQAKKSIPALLQIRQEWDRYLTYDDTGSAIPTGWVLPCQPSNDTWASAMIQE